MAKNNEYYVYHIPVRVTEQQDAELRKHAKEAGVSLSDHIRSALVVQCELTEGPAARAKNGVSK